MTRQLTKLGMNDWDPEMHELQKSHDSHVLLQQRISDLAGDEYDDTFCMATQSRKAISTEGSTAISNTWHCKSWRRAIRPMPLSNSFQNKAHEQLLCWVEY